MIAKLACLCHLRFVQPSDPLPPPSDPRRNEQMQNESLSQVHSHSWEIALVIGVLAIFLDGKILEKQRAPANPKSRTMIDRAAV